MKPQRKSLYYRIVSFFLHIGIPKARTEFEVPPGDEPAVFIGNHASTHGPLMVTFYFPRRHKTWVIADAVDRIHTQSYAYHDVLVGDSRECFRFWKMIAGLIRIALPPILIYDTIMVYRDRRVLETCRRSVDALMQGNDIFIFGEGPQRHSDYVNEIQPGFASLGRMYYRKTGKKLKFFPIYLNRENRLISVGRPIEFNPDADPDDFKKTACTFIRDEIDRLGRSMKPHRIVPFLPQRWYDAYGERFEKDVAGYWKMIETDGRFYST